MSLLFLKLVLTPLMVFAVSLVSRHRGEATGAWLVGLPLTSGPISAFLTLERGPEFAYAATSGSMAGVTAQAFCCLGYAAVARFGRLTGVAAGTLAYAVSAVVLQRLGLANLTLLILALASLAGTLVLFKREAAGLTQREAPAAWEVPLRAIIVTAIVIGLTAGAERLGPGATGAAASYPVIGLMMAVLAHGARGPRAAVDALRGMASALPAFVVFFFVVSQLVERTGPFLTFAAATGAALLAQAVSYRYAPPAPSR